MKKPRTLLTLMSQVLSSRRRRPPGGKPDIRKAVIFAVGTFVGYKLGLVNEIDVIATVRYILGL